jgi:long-chain acyl-CoA synthetase
MMVDRIWLKNYHKDVPADINPEAYSSIVEFLDESCKIYSNYPAFYSFGSTITYQEFEAYSHIFAAYLQQVLKLKKGDRVAIMLPNLLQYPIVLLGILRVGLVVVNVNPLYTATELTHQLNDAGCETIIVLANFAHTVQEALPHTSLKHVIVSNFGDMLAWPKGMIFNFVLKYIKKKIPAWHIPQAIAFKTILSTGKKYTFQTVPLEPHDLAFLQYTGGTTGISKGVMLTHRNMVSSVEQAVAWFKPIFEPGHEVIITALPLYHIFSLTANCLFLSRVGGLNVLIANPRDINQLVSTMAKFKFTAITGVNTLFAALLKNPRFPKLDFSRLKLCLGGGAPVMKVVADKWQLATGVVLLEAYGLTETSPCVSINPTTLTAYNASVGLPASSTWVAILDDEGREVPLGQPGEVAVKGPQVMQGYWRNPVETQKAFSQDGWLLTGDIGSIDQDGFLRILERKKDMILVSGFNVYPNEIENVLLTMPGIHEVAVVKAMDELSGEVPKAFIVRDNPALSVEEVIAFCRKQLTGYKIPKYITFCNELPKTNVGKVLRRALR